jgi:hypothetical protein
MCKRELWGVRHQYHFQENILFLLTALSTYSESNKGKGKVAPVLFLTEHHAIKAY